MQTPEWVRMAGTTSHVCVYRYLERERENLLDSRNHAICWDQRQLVYRPALQGPSVGWGQGAAGGRGTTLQVTTVISIIISSA